MNTRASGSEGENFAAAYITEQGMKILARNYHYGREEIDIIARDGDTLVFIEVKARLSASKGLPEEAVTKQKQRSIISAAKGYLKKNNLFDSRMRFDVASILGTDIKYIEAAFDATGMG